MKVKIIEGSLEKNQGKYLIVASKFNHFVVDSLIKGAYEALRLHGIQDDHIELIKVPGAYELPLICKMAIESKKPDGIIALGAVIRGSTARFDYVAGECAKGLGQLSLTTGVPIGFGVITTDSIEQALERAGLKAGNKGAEAAASVLEMVNLKNNL